jgi:RNA polymerase primary sigma factor
MKTYNQASAKSFGDFTLQEIADKLNISKERVRQIEQMALKKLKHPKISKELREYINL